MVSRPTSGPLGRFVGEDAVVTTSACHVGALLERANIGWRCFSRVGNDRDHFPQPGISVASDQRSTTPMTSHRIKDRIAWAGLPLMDDLARANTECCVLFRPLGTKPLTPESDRKSTRLNSSHLGIS